MQIISYFSFILLFEILMKVHVKHMLNLYQKKEKPNQNIVLKMEMIERNKTYWSIFISQITFKHTFDCQNLKKKNLITDKIKPTFYLYKMFYVLCKLPKSGANFIGEKNWKNSPGKMYVYMYTLSTKHTDHYQEYSLECPRHKNRKMDLSKITERKQI